MEEKFAGHWLQIKNEPITSHFLHVILFHLGSSGLCMETEDYNNAYRACKSPKPLCFLEISVSERLSDTGQMCLRAHDTSSLCKWKQIMPQTTQCYYCALTFCNLRLVVIIHTEIKFAKTIFPAQFVFNLFYFKLLPCTYQSVKVPYNLEYMWDVCLLITYKALYIDCHLWHHLPTHVSVTIKYYDTEINSINYMSASLLGIHLDKTATWTGRWRKAELTSSTHTLQPFQPLCGRYLKMNFKGWVHSTLVKKFPQLSKLQVPSKHTFWNFLRLDCTFFLDLVSREQSWGYNWNTKINI